MSNNNLISSKMLNQALILSFFLDGGNLCTTDAESVYPLLNYNSFCLLVLADLVGFFYDVGSFMTSCT